MRSLSTLFVLPSIPDDLDPSVKDGLAVRNAATVEGRCPVCLVEPELHPGGAGIYHLVFRHDDDCPATRDPYDWRDQVAPERRNP
jgi:hypothetical protein